MKPEAAFDPALPPCPSSGKRAYVQRNDFRGTWEIRCEFCPTFVWGDTEAEARSKWEAAQKRDAA